VFLQAAATTVTALWIGNIRSRQVLPNARLCRVTGLVGPDTVFAHLAGLALEVELHLLIQFRRRHSRDSKKR